MTITARPRLKQMLGAVLFGAGVFAAMPAMAQEGVTVIEAGKVLAVPGQGYLSRQSIRIKQGRIVSVTPGYVRQPMGTVVIKQHDGLVLPGLIDSHVHITSEFSPTSRQLGLSDSEVDEALWGVQFAKRTLLAGFTTVQDVGGEIRRSGDL